MQKQNKFKFKRSIYLMSILLLLIFLYNNISCFFPSIPLFYQINDELLNRHPIKENGVFKINSNLGIYDSIIICEEVDDYKNTSLIKAFNEKNQKIISSNKLFLAKKLCLIDEMIDYNNIKTVFCFKNGKVYCKFIYNVLYKYNYHTEYGMVIKDGEVIKVGCYNNFNDVIMSKY